MTLWLDVRIFGQMANSKYNSKKSIESKSKKISWHTMFGIGQDFAAHCTFFAPNLLYGSGWDGETVKKVRTIHFIL